MKKMTRINKYLSEAGYCSRREADRLIKENKVTINGKIPEIGTKVQEGDVVRVEGKQISNDIKRIYLAFYKPIGVVSTTDTKEPNNIVDYIGYPTRLFHVGRLDKDSEGLILMTNDGDIVNKILRARNNHEKEYLVTVKQPITKSFIKKMGEGVPILDTVTKKCVVEQIDKYRFRIILTQGLNRQIRRMCEQLGNKVRRLERYRIMNINLDVPLGQWRYLSKQELAELNQLLSDSSKTIADDETH